MSVFHRSKKVKDGHKTAPSSNMGTLLTNTNYGQPCTNILPHISNRYFYGKESG